MLDLDGRTVGHCDLDTSEVFDNDSTNHTFTWEGNPEIPGVGDWRKLHFLVRDAEIFSFRMS